MMDPAAFRDRTVVRDLSRALAEIARGHDRIRIMHVCGTHEHEIVHYGLRQLLPENVELIAGPGCPVCITPAGVIATAAKLARLPERPILCTYGDMVRVPAPGGSLLAQRGDGLDVRVIYSIRDVISLARKEPDRRVVFFSVGFETTAAPVAGVIRAGWLSDNLSILTCHRYVPAAVIALAAAADIDIQGFLLPGHASVITGIEPYRELAETYGISSAVAGFEPVDILAGILSIVRQIAAGTPTVANCYPRAVRDEGNPVARRMIDEVFDCTDGAWRGLGVLPGTGLVLKPAYRGLDALARFNVELVEAPDTEPGCLCHLVLIGKAVPEECPLFTAACTPENPRGACMVSNEGTCRAHFLFPEALS